MGAMAFRTHLAAFVLLLGTSLAAGCAPAPSPASASPAACRAIDGDTVACGTETVRISNIDTPELPPHARCAFEADLAQRAKAATAAHLAAGPVEIQRDQARPRDRYGRTLAKLRLASGQDLGEALIAVGLARAWDGRRRPWCVSG
jgi:micrococcal nuclease